jgi:hypothetical protein
VIMTARAQTLASSCSLVRSMRLFLRPDLARPSCLDQDVVAPWSVTAVAKRWLHHGDGVQIKIDDLLKRQPFGAVAQAFG